MFENSVMQFSLSICDFKFVELLILVPKLSMIKEGACWQGLVLEMDSNQFKRND